MLAEKEFQIKRNNLKAKAGKGFRESASVYQTEIGCELVRYKQNF